MWDELPIEGEADAPLARDSKPMALCEGEGLNPATKKRGWRGCGGYGWGDIGEGGGAVARSLARWNRRPLRRRSTARESLAPERI